MTLGAVGFGRGFPRIWLLPILTMIVLLGLAVIGRFSRSIVADLLAWWAVWVGIGALAYMLRNSTLGPIRVAGLVPLLAFCAVALFSWGHIAGWTLMPSASQRLVGPETRGYTRASLVADVDGLVHVEAGSEFLYQVEPIRRGGSIGVPGAAEEVDGGSIAVMLGEMEDPGVYTYAGWDVSLATTASWALRLSGALDADLSAVSLEGLSLDGSGTVRLGEPSGEVPIAIHGSIRLVIPTDVRARVIGVASVPATWIPTSEGARAPTGGAGWVITVDTGATLAVANG